MSAKQQPIMALDFESGEGIDAILNSLLHEGYSDDEESDEEGGFEVAEGTTSLVNRQGTDRFYSKVEEQAAENAKKLKRWLDVKDGSDAEPQAPPPPPPPPPPPLPEEATFVEEGANAAEKCREKRLGFFGRFQPKAKQPAKRPSRSALLLQAQIARNAATTDTSGIDVDAPSTPIPADESNSSAFDVPEDNGPSRTAEPSPMVSLAWGEQLRPILLQVMAEVEPGQEQPALALLATLHANLKRGDKFRKVAIDKLGPLSDSIAALQALRYIGFNQEETAEDRRQWLCCRVTDQQRFTGVARALRWGQTVAAAFHTLVSVMGHPKEEALAALKATEGDGVKAIDFLRTGLGGSTLATEGVPQTSEGVATSSAKEAYAAGYSAGYAQGLADARASTTRASPDFQRDLAPPPRIKSRKRKAQADVCAAAPAPWIVESMDRLTMQTNDQNAACPAMKAPGPPNDWDAPLKSSQRSKCRCFRELKKEEVLQGLPSSFQATLQRRLGKRRKHKLGGID